MSLVPRQQTNADYADGYKAGLAEADFGAAADLAAELERQVAALEALAKTLYDTICGLPAQGECVDIHDAGDMDKAMAAYLAWRERPGQAPLQTCSGTDQRQGADSPFRQAFAEADQTSPPPANKPGQEPCEPEPTPVAQSAPATHSEGTTAGGESALDEMRARKDAAYEERNRVVAALAWMTHRAGWNVGIARTAIEGWSDDWHGCVYIDLPTGQVSWHFHDSHAAMFDGLPPYAGAWDGHDTPEKYRRVAALREGNSGVSGYEADALEADFAADTWTFKMRPGYRVSAGRFLIVPLPPQPLPETGGSE